MSVLIKGMEMPKSCLMGGCPLDGTSCDLWKDKYWDDWEEPGIKRHPDCPLVEIPPHGRLIDSYALISRIYDAAKQQPEIADLYEDEADSMIAWLKTAPTIIPAEEQKEEQFWETEQLKQDYYHAFCSRCGRPVIAKKEEAFWWPGGTTDDHLCVSCDVCGGLAEV